MGCMGTACAGAVCMPLHGYAHGVTRLQPGPLPTVRGSGVAATGTGTPATCMHCIQYAQQYPWITEGGDLTDRGSCLLLGLLTLTLRQPAVTPHGRGVAAEAVAGRALVPSGIGGDRRRRTCGRTDRYGKRQLCLILRIAE